jgi:hypothetical protein
LEMFVARELQTHGFHVLQSEYYRDLDTQKQREIDVIAYLSAGRAGKDAGTSSGYFRCTLVIECKLSRNQPWILFSSQKPRLSPRAWVVQRVASQKGSKWLALMSGQLSQNAGIFEVPQYAGYAVTQAFRKGENDSAYGACIAVSKAARAWADKTDSRRRTRIAEIVLPVVVIESQLFDARLSTSGDISLSEKTAGLLVWRNPVAGLPYTIIHIVTRKTFGGFARKVRKDFVDLLKRAKQYSQALDFIEASPSDAS